MSHRPPNQGAKSAQIPLWNAGFPSDPPCRVHGPARKSDPRDVDASGGQDHRGLDSVDVPKVPPRSAAAELAGLLDSPEIAGLIRELEETRQTGRPGYPIRSMVGMALAKSLYAIPTWSRTVRLVSEHAALRDAIGAVPSQWSCYRFARKLREHSDALAACLDRVTAGLHAAHPDMGRDVAIDGSDLPAYANGQRYVSKNGPERERFSDPDASWGHRSAVSTRKGGGYYGYKVHAAVCAVTGLPVAWTVETASAAETNYALPLEDVPFVVELRDGGPGVMVRR